MVHSVTKHQVSAARGDDVTLYYVALLGETYTDIEELVVDVAADLLHHAIAELGINKLPVLLDRVGDHVRVEYDAHLDGEPNDVTVGEVSR